MSPTRLFLLTMWVCCSACSAVSSAQEASAGFDLRATLTGQAVASSELTESPRSGAPMLIGSRSVVYPTWKASDHWFATAALQLTTRPYYYWELSTPGYGANGQVLQATLNYAYVFPRGSILVRAGQMSTAFGSFVLRYDDLDNPLVDVPIEYGYYDSPVSISGLAGAQLDATRGKWDARAQFTNSSPANPRSIFARDQYGNWAGGFGYTVRQGFRIGASGSRGPFLSRDYKYFFHGEENPNKLPAHALGLDANWAHGHTMVQGELQKFTMPYAAVPTFHEKAGYIELKQAIGPRWYAAGRYGWSRTRATTQTFETAAGFRPDRFQLIKVGYEVEHYSTGEEENDKRLGIQFVTTFHKSKGRE